MISLATLKDFCGEYTSEYPSMSEIIHIKCKFVGILFVLASITMKIPGHGTGGTGELRPIYIIL